MVIDLLYHEGMSIISGWKSVPGIVAVNWKNGKFLRIKGFIAVLGNKGDNISALEWKGIITWEHGTWKLQTVS
nr:hypothetical protein [Tanacetum cinerariifolium]